MSVYRLRIVRMRHLLHIHTVLLLRYVCTQQLRPAACAAALVAVLFASCAVRCTVLPAAATAFACSHTCFIDYTQRERERAVAASSSQHSTQHSSRPSVRRRTHAQKQFCERTVRTHAHRDTHFHAHSSTHKRRRARSFGAFWTRRRNSGGGVVGGHHEVSHLFGNRESEKSRKNTTLPLPYIMFFLTH